MTAHCQFNGWLKSDIKYVCVLCVLPPQPMYSARLRSIKCHSPFNVGGNRNRLSLKVLVAVLAFLLELPTRRTRELSAKIVRFTYVLVRITYSSLIFHPLEVVGRDSETQLQMSEKCMYFSILSVNLVTVALAITETNPISGRNVRVQRLHNSPTYTICSGCNVMIPTLL